MKSAGGWRRFFADCIDMVIVKLGLAVVIALIEVLFMKQVPDSIVPALFAFVSYFLYFPLLESSSAQSTFGQRAVKIRVVSQDNEQLSFFRALWRQVIGNGLTICLFFTILAASLVQNSLPGNAGRFIILLVFCIVIFGYLVTYYIRLFSSRSMTFRDYLSGTLMMTPVREEVDQKED
jgi:hypothetical protein